MCVIGVISGESSSKFVNGLQQKVRPFLSIVEEKTKNGVVLEYAAGIVIDGHDKVLSWRANVKGRPLIVFLRLVKMLGLMKSVSTRDIEPCWYFCRTTANLHDSHAKYIAALKESMGPEGYEDLKRIRKEVLSIGPNPSEYEEIIKTLRGSKLSEEAKDYLIPLCWEGKEFYNKI